MVHCKRIVEGIVAPLMGLAVIRLMLRSSEAHILTCILNNLAGTQTLRYELLVLRPRTCGLFDRLLMVPQLSHAQGRQEANVQNRKGENPVARVLLQGYVKRERALKRRAPASLEQTSL